MPYNKKNKKRGAAGSSTAAARPSLPLPSNPVELEQLLLTLLNPDNASLAHATAVLNEFLRQPASLPALLNAIVSSQSAQVRQMGAVLLRRRLKPLWSSASNATRDEVKRVLLHQLLHETVRVVRRSIAALISRVAEEALPGASWPQLLDFLFQCTRSSDAEHREMGMLLFRALAENIPRHLKPHAATLQAIFVSGLADADDRVRVEALYALDALIEMVDPEKEKEVMAFSSSIPALVALVQSYLSSPAASSSAPHDNEVLSVVFEVFDSLASSPAPVLDAHLGLIAPMMIAVMSSGAFDLNIREQAALFLMSLAQAKPKRLTRLGLVPQLLSAVFPLLCEEDDHADSDEVSLQHIGADLLDAISLNVSKKQTFDICIRTASALLQQTAAPGQQKGGLVVIAVVAEAFAELLQPVVDDVIAAVLQLSSHASRFVRTAAWVALNQLAQHCDEAFVKYSRLVLPAAFAALSRDAEDEAVREKACYALEVMSESLQPADIAPQLQQVMTRLLALMHSDDPAAQSSALMAVKSVADIAQADFTPYLLATMQPLSRLLALTEDDQLMLRCKATECAGHVAAAVGKEAFAPYLQPCLRLVVEGMQLQLFELRESGYVFFSKLCELLQEGFAELLTTVLPLVLASCSSDEGVDVRLRSGGLDDDDDDGDEYDSELQDDDGDEQQDGDEAVMRRLNYSIRSGALDEKVSALACLSFIFATQTAPLRPFIDRCCVVLEEMLDFQHGRVREAATTAIFDLLQWHHRVFPLDKPVKGQLMAQLPEPHSRVLQYVMPTQVRRLEEEDEREAVRLILELIEACILLYGFTALRDCRQPLQKQLLLLLKEKAACQRPTDDEEDALAEHDVVLDCTCEVVGALAKTGGALYLPMLKEHAPLLLRFTEPGREPSTRGMAIGCWADMVQELGAEPGMRPWLDRVTAVALRGMEDVSVEVRRNSTFCTAALISNTGQRMTQHYHAVIASVEKLMLPPAAGQYVVAGAAPGAETKDGGDSKEERKEERRHQHEQRVSEEDYLGCRDNAASVVVRMLVAAAAQGLLPSLPLPRLLSLLSNTLPLQVDQQEAAAVYGGLISLYREHAAVVADFTPRLLCVFAEVFGHPDVDTAVQRDMVAFCRQLMTGGNSEWTQRVLQQEMTDRQRQQFVSFVVDGAELSAKQQHSKAAANGHSAATPHPSAAHAASRVNGHAPS